MPLNRVIYNLPYGSSFSTFSKSYNLQLPTKLIGSYIEHAPLVRQFGFSVSMTDQPLRNYFNSNPKEVSGKISIRTHNVYTRKNFVKYCELISARKYSSTEKPDSPTTGTGLADQIMQTRMKEPSQTKQAEEDLKNTGDTPQGPKPVGKWQKVGYMAFAIFLGGALVVNGVLFSLPDRDEEGNDIKDEFSELSFPSQHYLRLKNKIFKTKKDLEEPFSDKLLPDPLPEPYHQPKYTILLELTGLLVHSNWTHKHGWRFQKRPGVDIFISQIGYPDFELVVYTSENAMTFYPIVDGLDPENKYIMYRLFRDATRYVDGHHTKDLFALNRDLKKMIVVDWNENSVPGNRDNALILKKWEGDNTDRQLIGLTQLLQAIKQSDVDDVREVLRYYKQYDDPIEAFRENQRKLQETMAAEEKIQKEKQNQSQGGIFSSSLSSFRRFGR